MTEQTKNVCTGCSLLCDDIIIEREDGKLNEVIGACLKGNERFEQIDAKNRILKPLIRKNDELKESDWDKAIEKTLQLIQESSNPLLYGFSTTTCEAQLEGMKLAKQIDGFIDSNSIICQGKTLNKAKSKGMTTCTLTEIINKGDVIVLWGFNPIESIPRLLNKILFSRGKFRMTGREIKTLIVIDPVETASYNIMGPRDIPLLIEPECDVKLIRALKQKFVEDQEIPSEGIVGIDKNDFERLSANLIDSEHVSIFVGQGLLRSQKEGNALEELIEMVDIINAEGEKGRVSLLFPGGHYNMIGFDHTALSYAGKNHSLQFKNHTLENSSKEDIIAKINNDDFDLSIIVGTDPISHFPVQLSKKLASKPMILLDNRKSSSYFLADVILPTAITGVESGGTAIRLDNVPIHIDKLVEPPDKIPSDEQLLRQINDKLNTSEEEN